MQVLAGKYKNRRLQSSASPKVKPTARRLREALFDFLGARILEARFLDLCAGSGAVGIEALSRGAAQVTFVDRAARMLNFIKLNLERCAVPEEQVNVIQGEATGFLQSATASERGVWDVAFFDPPYATDYAPVLALFGQGAALEHNSGILVVEHHCEKILADRIGILRRQHIIHQGESCLSFYERKPSARDLELTADS